MCHQRFLLNVFNIFILGVQRLLHLWFWQ